MSGLNTSIQDALDIAASLQQQQPATSSQAEPTVSTGETKTFMLDRKTSNKIALLNVQNGMKILKQLAAACHDDEHTKILKLCITTPTTGRGDNREDVDIFDFNLKKEEHINAIQQLAAWVHDEALDAARTHLLNLRTSDSADVLSAMGDPIRSIQKLIDALRRLTDVEFDDFTVAAAATTAASPTTVEVVGVPTKQQQIEQLQQALSALSTGDPRPNFGKLVRLWTALKLLDPSVKIKPNTPMPLSHPLYTVASMLAQRMSEIFPDQAGSTASCNDIVTMLFDGPELSAMVNAFVTDVALASEATAVEPALQTFLDAILGGPNTTMVKHKGTRIKVKDMTPSSMLAGATHYLHLLFMVCYPAAEHFAAFLENFRRTCSKVQKTVAVALLVANLRYIKEVVVASCYETGTDVMNPLNAVTLARLTAVRGLREHTQANNLLSALAAYNRSVDFATFSQMYPANTPVVPPALAGGTGGAGGGGSGGNGGAKSNIYKNLPRHRKQPYVPAITGAGGVVTHFCMKYFNGPHGATTKKKVTDTCNAATTAKAVTDAAGRVWQCVGCQSSSTPPVFRVHTKA